MLSVTVQKAMQYLTSVMPSEGMCGGRAYTHGIATYSLAEAYGIEARALSRPASAPAAVEWIFSVRGPALLHVSVPEQANVWPIVPPGGANDEMLHAPPAEEAAWAP